MEKLSWEVPAPPVGGATVAHVRGDLDLAGHAGLVDHLASLLTERPRVVLGVSGLRLHHSLAVHGLREALSRAGGWPQARLVLAGPDATLAALLTSSRVADEVPAFPTEPEALAHLDDRPPLVRTSWRFTVDPHAPGRARAHVRDVCSRWTIEGDTREAAEIVITELVTNAVEHASSPSVVEVEYHDHAFRLTVRDFDVADAMPSAPAWTAPPTSSPRGRGLAMVAAVSRHWGVLQHPDGKTVWAEMSTSPDTT